MRIHVKKVTSFGVLLILGLGNISTSTASELRIYNWTEYLPKSVIADFQKETGITVQYDVFDTAETLETKLMTGSSGYDVAFPAHSQIPRLEAAGAILPLDHEKIPNWKKIDPAFLQNLALSDPGNAYAAPYLWGTTVIGYNADKVKAALKGEAIPNSWSLVLDPKYAEKLKACGIAFLDAPTEIFPITLNYLKLDPHALNEESLKQARDLLLTVRPNIKYFQSARWVQDLANGDICVAVGYSGAINMAKELARSSGTDVKVEMMLPDEGALAWSDDMVIPKGASNEANAYRFIDYILRPDVIAKISNNVGYPNAIGASAPLIDKEKLTNETLFIPENKREKLFFPIIPSLKIERVSTRFWNTVKSGA